MTRVARCESLVAAAAVLGGGMLGASLVLRLMPSRPDCRHSVPGIGGVVAGVRYLEEMRGGATPGDTVPMVIVLHALGARPEGYVGMFQGVGRARIIVPEGALGSETARKWWSTPVRAAVLDPEKSAAAVSEWKTAAERMEQFVRAIVECRPTQGRPIITGSSQGAEMALLLASLHPRLFTGAVATAGYLLPPFWSKRMAPTRMIHGTGDRTVPFAWADQYVRSMKAEGADLELVAHATDPSQDSGHYVTRAMAREWSAMVASLVLAAARD